MLYKDPYTTLVNILDFMILIHVSHYIHDLIR